MEISIAHKGLDWLIHVTDYDYDPPEKGVQPSLTNPGEPSYPESARITEGFVQLDGAGELAEQVNTQLYNREGALFDYLVAQNEQVIEGELLDMIHARQESQERDYEAEAEEAEVERREEFKNKEVKW